MSTDRYIDGIDNYCDRWCERCNWGLRCRVFDQIERDDRRHARRGQTPQDSQSADSVLEDVGRNLAKVHRLLSRFARREGINLGELANKASQDIQGSQPNEAGWHDQPGAADQPLVRQADAFMIGCRKLLDRLRSSFDESADDLRSRKGFMDVAGETELLARVRESFEVLCWDHTLVPVKLRRALVGQHTADESDDPELREFHARDGTGSGAVVRRSLLRSQAALLQIYDWDATLGDEVIDLLACTDRLLHTLDARLPAAKTFTWPPSAPPAEPGQGPGRLS
jgi:hypothetical protein